MKVHKIIDGPFLREDEDDPWEMTLYIEDTTGQFQIAHWICYDWGMVQELQNHMNRPTLEPYELKEVENNGC